MYLQKIYALIHNESGRRFSFNARDEIEANFKAEDWVDYHGMKMGGSFRIEETDLAYDLHNDFIESTQKK